MSAPPAPHGVRRPPVANYRHAIEAARSGRLTAIDNRKLGRLAKLAGEPEARAAGIEFHARLGDPLGAGAPLCTLHADAPGELSHALSYASANADMFRIEDI